MRLAVAASKAQCTARVAIIDSEEGKSRKGIGAPLNEMLKDPPHHGH